MKIQILGAHNTRSRTARMTSILIDGVLALDAGSLASSLSFRAQAKVRDLLITHGHYDHVADIPAFAMNLFLRGKTVNIYCSPAVQKLLLDYLLNGDIYPDFTQRPPGNPIVRFTLVEPDRSVTVGGYTVRPVALRHALPALGYEITSADRKRVFYTGDTGADLAEAWKRTAPDLLIIEVTASNRYESTVREAFHLTPGLLRQQLTIFRQMHGYVPRVVGVHMNPEMESEIRQELADVAAALGTEIIPAREGLTLRL